MYEYKILSKLYVGEFQDALNQLALEGWEVLFEFSGKVNYEVLLKRVKHSATEKDRIAIQQALDKYLGM